MLSKRRSALAEEVFDVLADEETERSVEHIGAPMQLSKKPQFDVKPGHTQQAVLQGVSQPQTASQSRAAWAVGVPKRARTRRARTGNQVRGDFMNRPPRISHDGPFRHADPHYILR
jgi:hypothetical protein